VVRNIAITLVLAAASCGPDRPAKPGDKGLGSTGMWGSPEGGETAHGSEGGGVTVGSIGPPLECGPDATDRGEVSLGAKPYDCDDLPAEAVACSIIQGPIATEDLAFDDLGNLVGMDAYGNLFRSPKQGSPILYSPLAGTQTAGLRALPWGDIVFSDVGTATIVRVNAAGVKTPVLSGMVYANGIEVDTDGFVYTTEQGAGRVRMIDPDTGKNAVVASGLSEPNGISFNPDYSVLYIGSFGEGTIQALAMDEQGEPGALKTIATEVGGGYLDGLGVDACGNIYVCEYVAAVVWRISPDGASRVAIADLSVHTEWIPNLDWGSGVGGWDSHSLYILEYGASRVFEIPVGVPSKPRAYP
jgi:sugar lactone lactonase YvrE